MVPKDTLLPRCARPRLRPFITFRNLVRFGCNIVNYPLATAALFARGLACLLFLLNLVHTAQDFTTEDPYLDADGAVGGLGTHAGVIDISAQGVQRHTAFTVPLGASNLCAAQTTGELHPNAFSTRLEGVLYGTFHGATEHHTALDLASDVVGNQARIHVGLAHFFNVD